MRKKRFSSSEFIFSMFQSSTNTLLLEFPFVKIRKEIKKENRVIKELSCVIFINLGLLFMGVRKSKIKYNI